MEETKKDIELMKTKELKEELKALGLSQSVSCVRTHLLRREN
jgi:hypothetical protein